MRSFRVVLAVGALAVAVAAPLSGQGLRGGVKAGIASATFGGDDVDDAESRTAFWAGGFLTFPLTPGFAIQPEVLYASKGAAASGAFDGDVELRIAYIEIPVLAKFTVGTSIARPYFFAGPTIGFKVSCEVEARGGGISISADCDEDEEAGSEIKSVDIGAAFGAGFDYDLGGVTLVVDGRYGLGFSSIVEGPGDPDVKNRAFAFLAGVSIPLGGVR
jgi:hypothetical protein